EVGPVTPVLAVLVLAEALVIGAHEAFRIAPDGLHHARPGISNADVAGLAGIQLIAVIVVNYRLDARQGRAGTARLHVVYARYRAAQDAAGFGLPPGIHDDRLVLADGMVVPAPGLGLDGFADGGHVLEVEIVFGGLIGRARAQGAD